MNLEYFILTLSYFGIFLLLSINGFFSFPSSQIIYIIAGYFAYTGDLNIYYVIAFGALGQTLGNWILYEVSRKKGLEYGSKFISYLFPYHDTKKEIQKFQIAFNKSQIFLLFIGKLVNPIKIFIPIPAGIAKVNRAIFLIIVYITSAIWATVFTFIGFYFGKNYQNFGYIGAILFLIALTVMYSFYRLMNSKEVIEELEGLDSDEKIISKNKKSKKTSKNNKKKSKQIK